MQIYTDGMPLTIKLFGACFIDSNNRLVAQHEYSFVVGRDKVKVMFDNKYSRWLTGKNIHKQLEKFGTQYSVKLADKWIEV